MIWHVFCPTFFYTFTHKSYEVKNDASHHVTGALESSCWRIPTVRLGNGQGWSHDMLYLMYLWLFLSPCFRLFFLRQLYIIQNAPRIAFCEHWFITCTYSLGFKQIDNSLIIVLQCFETEQRVRRILYEKRKVHSNTSERLPFMSGKSVRTSHLVFLQYNWKS